MKSFFKIPLKIHHGLLLVTNLAEKYGSGEPVSLVEVAKKEQISQGFLEEIAAALRSGGIIEGRRGSRGGYVLTKNPASLTIADIITAIEGPMAVVDCLSEASDCALSARCTNRSVWSKVQSEITRTLQGMRVNELI